MANDRKKDRHGLYAVDGSRSRFSSVAEDEDGITTEDVSVQFFSDTGVLILTIEHVEEYGAVDEEDSPYYGYSCVDTEPDEKGFFFRYFVGRDDYDHSVVFRGKCRKKMI